MYVEAARPRRPGYRLRALVSLGFAQRVRVVTESLRKGREKVGRVIAPHRGVCTLGWEQLLLLHVCTRPRGVEVPPGFGVSGVAYTANSRERKSGNRVKRFATVSISCWVGETTLLGIGLLP